ncbi:hypothetical protein AeRB84_013996, partial [Aphanomyces euteiches]
MKQKHDTELAQGKTRTADANASAVVDEVSSESNQESPDCDETLEAESSWLAVVTVNAADCHRRSNLSHCQLQWIVDSGATHHICWVKEMFDEIKPTNMMVNLPDDYQVKADGIGTVRLTVASEGKEKFITLILHDVLFVPKRAKNLFSIPRASKASEYSIDFDFRSKPGHVVLKRGETHIVSSPNPSNVLFFLNHIPKVAEANTIVTPPSFELWHKRLGHPAASTMKQLLVKNAVRGLKFPDVDISKWVCDACQLGNQKKRVTFPLSTSPVFKCNDKVHSDLCGPMEVPSLSGGKYVLIFVDRYSRYIHAHILNEKSETGKIIVEHRAIIESKHNLPLKNLHTDNGGEFLDGQIVAFCRREGIEHTTTTTMTSQQNGFAEVRFRDIQARARTMLIQADCPSNCGITLSNTTPFKLWNGYEPDVSEMKVFGSVCYVHVPTRVRSSEKAGNSRKKRQKLDVRAIRGIFVGYAETKHAYKVLGKLLVSLHVTFDESDSPAAKELRSADLKQLARIHSLDFNYYTRQATTEADRMFHSDVVQDLLDDRELSVLQDFVTEFNPESPELSSYEDIASYAPDIALANAVVLSHTNAIRVSQLQHKSELLVAKENLEHKTACSKLAIPASTVPVPRSYAEAKASKFWPHWLNAIKSEFNSLITNGTWKYIKGKSHDRLLSTTWVFRVKEKEDGSIDRFKARLVVRGFLQVKGLDFNEVFAPVVRLESLRSLLDTAFLNGLLSEKIGIYLPEGFLDYVSTLDTDAVTKLQLPDGDPSDLSLEL